MTSPLPWSVDSVEIRLAEVESRLNGKAAELDNVFIHIYLEDARLQYRNLIQLSAPSGASAGALAGALVSIKDLFDIKGKVTRAGTLFMANDAPAEHDAVPVTKLRDAGAIVLGHTNMTELAYSGLGLNPHYGTPKCYLNPECAPGGSSAGGAVSVAAGIADIALGTDTGGSLRIPAAFNGIVGFKPTQRSVSRTGCKALSRTLDSVGPMAASVRACQLAYHAMATGKRQQDQQLDRSFVIPDNFGMDDMQTPVALAFEHAVSSLSKAGFKIRTTSFKALERLKHLPSWQIAAVDALTEYNTAMLKNAQIIDPRVYTRIQRAEDVTADMYRQALHDRDSLIEEFSAELGSAVLLMPTTPILPPTLIELADDENYHRINAQVLRNTSIANMVDACSISLPLGFDNIITSLMLTASNGNDEGLLNLAAQCEGLLHQISD